MNRKMGFFIMTVVLLVSVDAISVAETVETVEGKVISTHLTACSPVAGKPGMCEGSLVIEHPINDKPAKTEFTITRDTVLTLDGKMALLPALNGTKAKVVYRIADGKRIAKSVVSEKVVPKR